MLGGRADPLCEPVDIHRVEADWALDCRYAVRELGDACELLCGENAVDLGIADPAAIWGVNRDLVDREACEQVLVVGSKVNDRTRFVSELFLEY
jgi:hypothetical protein